jgi:hypothetical protein
VAASAPERREGEEDGAGDEDSALAVEVGGATAEQQQAAEGDRVDVDHPLQCVGGEGEVVLDRGQRDVDDRDVE